MKDKIKRILTAPSRLAKKLYRWMLKWADTKYASLSLFLFAFAEASFFPIPPDVLLLSMVVAKPKRFFKFALLTTLGSVAGAILGYVIGYALFESVGRHLVEIYHLESQIESLGKTFADNALVSVLVASLTPIPYKAITIAAGLFKLGLPILLIASAVGRGFRFFLVSYLTSRFGERIKKFIEKYFDVLGLAFLILIVLGFVALKYL